MSDFKEQIEQAARRQRLFMGVLLGVLLLVGTFLALFVFLLKTTVVDVKPVEAGQTANVTMSGGVGIYVGNTVFSLTRYPAVTVMAEGFEIAQKVISPEEEGGLVRIDLKEKPATVLLNLTNGDESTRWQIKGQDQGAGSRLSVTLPAGDYTFTADHPYWQPLTESMTLKRGEIAEKELTLKPLIGKLTLNVTPEDAIVEVNGQVQEARPVQMDTPGGEYQVQITKDDYQSVEETIRITNRQTEAERNYLLVKDPAKLRVKVMPSGGKLTLNGKSIAAEQVISLSPGQKYFLSYRKEGYGKYEKELTLKPGQTRTETIELSLQIGEVKITSSPEANVMIGGKPYGKTPLTLRLPAYEQGVKLMREGYVSELRQVSPSPTQTKKIHVVLKTEKEAKLAAAKPSYKTIAGSVMKLFKPNTLTLGASRDQKGQRANEFIRNVELKRHFYVSETEVTVQQYSAFSPISGAGNYPVVKVSWEEAAIYCNWLSLREGLRPVYKIDGGKVRGFTDQADGYRLPTEAEWEWLARKAGRTRQSVFYWGDDPVVPKEAGNVADESAKGKSRFYIPNYVDRFAGAAPVKSFPAEQSGLYDLFGNVSEWVHDYYSLVPPRAGQTYVDPMGDPEGYQHMTKGANYLSGNLTEIRPAYRAPAEEPSETIGFRVARYLYGEGE